MQNIIQGIDLYWLQGHIIVPLAVFTTKGDYIGGEFYLWVMLFQLGYSKNNQIVRDLGNIEPYFFLSIIIDS